MTFQFEETSYSSGAGGSGVGGFSGADVHLMICGTLTTYIIQCVPNPLTFTTEAETISYMIPEGFFDLANFTTNDGRWSFPGPALDDDHKTNRRIGIPVHLPDDAAAVTSSTAINWAVRITGSGSTSRSGSGPSEVVVWTPGTIDLVQLSVIAHGFFCYPNMNQAYPLELTNPIPSWATPDQPTILRFTYDYGNSVPQATFVCESPGTMITRMIETHGASRQRSFNSSDLKKLRYNVGPWDDRYMPVQGAISPVSNPVVRYRRRSDGKYLVPMDAVTANCRAVYYGQTVKGIIGEINAHPANVKARWRIVTYNLANPRIHDFFYSATLVDSVNSSYAWRYEGTIDPLALLPAGSVPAAISLTIGTDATFYGSGGWHAVEQFLYPSFPNFPSVVDNHSAVFVPGYMIEVAA